MNFMCISSQSSHIIFLSGHAANPSKFECCTEALIDLQKSAGNIWVKLNVINACLDGMYIIIQLYNPGVSVCICTVDSVRV